MDGGPDGRLEWAGGSAGRSRRGWACRPPPDEEGTAPRVCSGIGLVSAYMDGDGDAHGMFSGSTPTAPGCLSRRRRRFAMASPLPSSGSTPCCTEMPCLLGRGDGVTAGVRAEARVDGPTGIV